MNFLGLFVICFILIVIIVTFFSSLLQNVWAVMALLAFVMAFGIQMYLSLEERVTELERRLGTTTEDEEKNLSEQIKENTTEA